MRQRVQYLSLREGALMFTWEWLQFAGKPCTRWTALPRVEDRSVEAGGATALASCPVCFAGVLAIQGPVNGKFHWSGTPYGLSWGTGFEGVIEGALEEAKEAVEAAFDAYLGRLGIAKEELAAASALWHKLKEEGGRISAPRRQAWLDSRKDK